MLRGALDEDIHGDIVREVRRRDPSLDIISIRETSLLSEPDHIILAWVAAEQRILFSHDANTMTAAAYARMAEGLGLPGLFIVPQWLPVGAAVEGILLVLWDSHDGEWENQVRYLPL